MIFTNFGNCHWIKAYQIPVSNKLNKGQVLNKFLSDIKDGEKVVGCISIDNFDDNLSVAILAEDGHIKRLKLSWFEKFRNRPYIVFPCEKYNLKVYEVRLVDNKKDFMAQILKLS